MNPLEIWGAFFRAEDLELLLDSIKESKIQRMAI